MKKHVLNIEKLYTGETANALVLSQVDAEPPVLLPSVPEGQTDLASWVDECRKIHSNFDPPREEMTRDKLNEYIVYFNLNLQKDFKKLGHDELYLMDDTQWMNPSPDDETFSSDKVNMHLLNGQMIKETDELDSAGNPISKTVNTSQLNVIFPFKKVSSKSLYSEQLSVDSQYDIDEKMERSMVMSLQGKVTSEKCLQGTATIGGNLYVMSPLVAGRVPEGNLLPNGMTIVNSFLDNPYYFPHTMSLFQPSKKHYDDENMQKDVETGTTPFIDWYKKHNRRTIVSVLPDYGGNKSSLACIGAASYEIGLATHSPTELVLDGRDVGESIQEIPLDADKFRDIRARNDQNNAYVPFEDEDGERVYKYVFDNSLEDGDDGFCKVGFKFNLYDNFISGDERILHMVVPRDTDFNHLILKFTCKVQHDGNLLGNHEYIVFVGDEEKYRLSYDGVKEVEFVDGEEMEVATHEREVKVPVSEAVLQSHEYDISVIVHYQVDFAKRNSESDYRSFLKSSGMTLMDIRVDNDVVETRRQLTFADYVNEDGISDEERDARMEQFWQLSRYVKDVPYQLVLETPLCNMTSSGLYNSNNYTTGDIYGDVFATKSVLDPRYDMNLDSDGDELHVRGRDYVDIGQCSSQLFLLFRDTDVSIVNGSEVVAKLAQKGGEENSR